MARVRPGACDSKEFNSRQFCAYRCARTVSHTAMPRVLSMPSRLLKQEGLQITHASV